MKLKRPHKWFIAVLTLTAVVGLMVIGLFWCRHEADLGIDDWAMYDGVLSAPKHEAIFDGWLKDDFVLRIGWMMLSAERRTEVQAVLAQHYAWEERYTEAADRAIIAYRNGHLSHDRGRGWIVYLAAVGRRPDIIEEVTSNRMSADWRRLREMALALAADDLGRLQSDLFDVANAPEWIHKGEEIVWWGEFMRMLGNHRAGRAEDAWWLAENRLWPDREVVWPIPDPEGTIASWGNMDVVARWSSLALEAGDREGAQALAEYVCAIKLLVQIDDSLLDRMRTIYSPFGRLEDIRLPPSGRSE